MISGTPNTPGNFTVMVKASDGILSNTRTFTWVVNDTPDDPITLANPGPQTSTEDQWQTEVGVDQHRDEAPQAQTRLAAGAL